MERMMYRTLVVRNAPCDAREYALRVLSIHCSTKNAHKSIDIAKYRSRNHRMWSIVVPSNQLQLYCTMYTDVQYVLCRGQRRECMRSTIGIIRWHSPLCFTIIQSAIYSVIMWELLWCDVGLIVFRSTSVSDCILSWGLQLDLCENYASCPLTGWMSVHIDWCAPAWMMKDIGSVSMWWSMQGYSRHTPEAKNTTLEGSIEL